MGGRPAARAAARQRPVAGGLLTRQERAAELRRLQARQAMDAAYEAELVIGLAGDTPETLDPSPDHPGAWPIGWSRGRRDQTGSLPARSP